MPIWLYDPGGGACCCCCCCWEGYGGGAPCMLVVGVYMLLLAYMGGWAGLA